MVERCTRCNAILTRDALEKGWPVQTETDLICPSCYGDEAYCPKGHLLRGDTDSDECETCTALPVTDGQKWNMDDVARDRHALPVEDSDRWIVEWLSDDRQASAIMGIGSTRAMAVDDAQRECRGADYTSGSLIVHEIDRR